MLILWISTTNDGALHSSIIQKCQKGTFQYGYFLFVLQLTELDFFEMYGII